MINKGIEKISINTGLTGEKKEKGSQEQIKESLALITGQKPLPTKAKQSIASFDITEGELLGFKVTLRGKRKDDFFEKMYKVVLPRMKDFEGIPTDNFDEHGNLTIGFTDAKIFPELREKHDLIDFGLEVTFVTTFDNKEDAIKFLKEQGMPLQSSAQEDKQ